MLKKIRSLKSSVKNHLTENFKNKKLTMCKKCYSFYYKSVWHFEAPNYIRDESEKEVPLRLTECPACMEQDLAIYERDSHLMTYGIFN